MKKKQVKEEIILAIDKKTGEKIIADEFESDMIKKTIKHQIEADELLSNALTVLHNKVYLTNPKLYKAMEKDYIVSIKKIKKEMNKLERCKGSK